ncbi:cell division protein FtsZ [Candidatus Micrarchaeota archaeon CG10_big_fil_rev_8_21_14_0_10_45_29]|nr:MAG: cell division protein FtsZ [Candidatus Micrarchaeota archaeon CG10_big_fil_rev_8_21_14_0_10_45_29]
MADKDGNLKFVVAGVGGGGCNSLTRLAKKGFKGAKLIAFNTDKKALGILPEGIERVIIGKSITEGFGAGGKIDIGRDAALSAKAKIEECVKDADLVFILAGMGGGTGSGAAPVIAEIAKEQKALVLGFVYFPFALERGRIRIAQIGISKLTDFCDSLVVIENDLLVNWMGNIPVEEAFAMADEVAETAVAGISKTILEPSLMNIDFADICAITRDKGLSMMSTGWASGPMKAHSIVPNVLEHPLLTVNYSAASGALIHFTGGDDLKLGDATMAGELLMSKLPDNVNVSWGARVDESKKGELEAFVIFTGIPSPLLLDPDAGME